MTIKFFIPSDQDIPTELRLIADDIHAYYRRLPDAPLAYQFDLYTGNNEKAEEIVNEVARIMRRQSYDHGAEWRVVETRCIEKTEMHQSFIVKFRVRDAG